MRYGARMSQHSPSTDERAPSGTTALREDQLTSTGEIRQGDGEFDGLDAGQVDEIVEALADEARAGSVLEQYPAAGPITITHHTAIGDPGHVEALWACYRTNIEPLATLAVLRHVDDREAFEAQLANPRIVKIVAWQDGLPVGLAMVTNSLEDVEEISPAFLRTKYPEHAARDAIYVGMLVIVSQPLRGRTVFSRLYTELWQVPALDAGILVFDVCEFNRTMFDTDALARRIASAFPRATAQVLDRQTWYVAELPEPIADHPRP